MNNENFFIYGLQDELNKLAKKQPNDNEWKNTKTTTEGDTTYQTGVGKRYEMPKGPTSFEPESTRNKNEPKPRETHISTQHPDLKKDGPVKFHDKSKSKKRLQEVVDKKKKQK